MSKTMSKTRKSAADRESAGWRTGVGGLLLAGVGLFEHLPRLVGLGFVVAVIGGIMWGAGMARRD
jgi:hypothetical protein